MIEDLLVSKSFAELTTPEKSFVLKELGSEGEYNSLRKISLALVADKADLSPDPRTISSLQRELRNIHRKQPWAMRFMEWRVPGYTLIPSLILLLFVSLNMLMQDSDQSDPPSSIASVDTVFIKMPSDTIVVEKILVKYRYNTSVGKTVTDYSIVRNVTQEENKEEGVTMKDKEELESLIVSGS